MAKPGDGGDTNEIAAQVFKGIVIPGTTLPTATTDTSSYSETRTVCVNQCVTDWEINWYQQQVNLLTSNWDTCEAVADKMLADGLADCRRYNDAYSGICIQQVFQSSETYRTDCVLNKAIKPNMGLKTPVDYATTKYLSWYDGKGKCSQYIALNSKAKSSDCKSKNCPP